MTDSRPPKPKRRWYQFRLRTLLVATLALGVCFAWIGSRLQTARKHRRAEAEIRMVVENAGGTAHFQTVEGTGFVGWLFGDPGVRRFIGVSAISPSEFDDAALGNLLAVTDSEGLSVEVLDLDGSKVTDAGLEHLTGRKNLRSLLLGGTCVTDAGLEHLTGLTNLRFLVLDGTQVSDTGLVHLEGLTNLEELWLGGTKVTDAGLEHLTGLTMLRDLELTETQVTAEGFERLQQALPRLFP